jgi:hypothetical protein
MKGTCTLNERVPYKYLNEMVHVLSMKGYMYLNESVHVLSMKGHMYLNEGYMNS